MFLDAPARRQPSEFRNLIEIFVSVQHNPSFVTINERIHMSIL